MSIQNNSNIASSTSWAAYEGPLGKFTLVAGSGALRHLYFPGQEPQRFSGESDPARLADVVKQLQQYFAGHRRTFDLDLDLDGTPLQRRVWRALQEIPYGETTTYGALARQLGVLGIHHKPSARAIGSAVARTPIPIIVPCHRVIGASGALTGYGGGLPRKRALLNFERSSGEPAALGSEHRDAQLSLT